MGEESAGAETRMEVGAAAPREGCGRGRGEREDGKMSGICQCWWLGGPTTDACLCYCAICLPSPPPLPTTLDWAPKALYLPLPELSGAWSREVVVVVVRGEHSGIFSG